MRWLSAPDDEIKGLTRLKTSNTHKHLLISPLEDGAVSIWSPASPIPLSRSPPGILSAYNAADARRARVWESGDNIVASSEMDKIYIAVDSTLLEMSLTTLQPISTTRFPFSISTLSSEMELQNPLTIGTTLTLHLHDPRVGSAAAAPSTALPSTFPGNFSRHAPLFQPSPLAILHHPNTSLYVAGRFPSILCYDRAMWPRLNGTIYSGGSLCSLAADGPQRLIAGGTYNGRGTLESYDLTSGGGELLLKNRQSASWGRILSVAKHGTRIVTCDTEGMISWFENDCRYLVRREDSEAYNIESVVRQNAIFRSTDEGSGPVRKAVVLEDTEAEEAVGVWAGDRIGILRPGREHDFEEDDGVLVEGLGELIQSELEEEMRKALVCQADEVRILGALQRW